MSCRACVVMSTVMATLTLAACAERAPEEGAALPATQGGELPAEHVGHGTLNSIDRAAGKVNISHEAVASAGWPAMTMSFPLADPASVPELAPGQRVEFAFTTEGGGTVTRITAAE